MELHAGDARHLLGQVVGHRGLQGEQPHQGGGEQGGQPAVEQLARQVGARRQAAAPQKD